MEQLALFAVKWWAFNRPFSKEKREYRRKLRVLRRENEERERLGMPLIEEQVQEVPALETGLRTSTVAGGTGIVSFIVMKLLAIVAPELAGDPNIQMAIAGLLAYVAARINKTPANPGRI